jgi:transposase-like protein
VCRSRFAITKGTLFYRLRTDPKLVVQVIVLLAYGCPLQPIVKAFGFDEPTIKTWWERAGAQCRAVHEQVVSSRSMDLQHVQADEIKVKVQGSHLWMALATMVSTRLWLAGVLDVKRDKKMMRQLAEQIRQMALCRPLLLPVDGWRAYVEAFQRALRSQLPAPGPGRSRLVAGPEIAIVHVVKQRLESELHIERQIVQG